MLLRMTGEIKVSCSRFRYVFIVLPYITSFFLESVAQASTESHKTLKRKIYFQIVTLNPHGVNKCFSFN